MFDTPRKMESICDPVSAHVRAVGETAPCTKTTVLFNGRHIAAAGAYMRIWHGPPGHARRAADMFCEGDARALRVATSVTREELCVRETKDAWFWYDPKTGQVLFALPSTLSTQV